MIENVARYIEHGESPRQAALRGSAQMLVDGQSFTLDPDHVIAVMPGTSRKVIPGDEGVRLLIVGGVPGQAYEAPAITELDAAA